ncbi:AfsR/SARP family transcriptional regulator [Planosporangium mesophilum]|uniref:AfsR/SARP family transcriptional regulator n=1 Tax=Planosporangium mesophilum TaxID=689768 RepID=UPI00143A95D8|nr:BTAD domain-containing putative transcriptional regulator [Planosporangium mesophilum]NJC82914.1 tetratricopeptide repeat protein [Planosporangium mesophilum]
MDFRVLGPLEAAVGGRVVAVGPPRVERILATLLLEPNRSVTLSNLTAALWDGNAPSSADQQVRNGAAALRRALVAAGAPVDIVVAGHGGYRLAIEPGCVDARRFTENLDRARLLARQGRLEQATDGARAALGLWRGDPFTGMDGRFIRSAATRLVEQRITALEEYVEWELALGRDERVSGELGRLVDEYPHREVFVGQWMRLLYRAGRHVEALAAYRQLRRRLVDEFGVEPGPDLQRLHTAILTGDPGLRTPAPGPVTLARPVPPPSPDGGTVRPAQLPPKPTGFVGRAAHLAELDGLLPDEGQPDAHAVVVAITGSAGVGKTALAVHWASRARRRFPDGQLYVNLRGYDPRPPVPPVQALGHLLCGLGVAPERIPPGLEDAAAMYRSVLADRRVLVLLDNAADAEQVRPLLPGGSSSFVVVTSRRRLGGLVALDGARELFLEVLSPDEARTLLAGILGAERVDGEPTAAADLARLCGYLPLAVRVAAANLARPGRSLAAYTADLRDGNRLAALTVTGDERATVRATFDLSYAALPAAASRLFRLVGLVPGPDLTVAAAAALLDATTGEAAQAVAHLTAACLLEEHVPDRYTCHDLLRAYAAGRVYDDCDEAARRAALGRLFDYYLHTADAAARVVYPHLVRLPVPAGSGSAVFDERTTAVAWLDSERANLVAAISHAADHGPLPVAWLLADAARGVLALGMHVPDALAAATAALRAARAAGHLAGEAAARIGLATPQWLRGRAAEARDQYLRACELAGLAGWEEGVAAAMGNVAAIDIELGHRQQAARRLADVLEINRRLGRLAGQASNLNNLAYLHADLGDLEQAADHARQAIVLYQKTGSRSGEAFALTNLGQAEQRMGYLDEAVSHLDAAVALHRELGNRGSQADALNGLAAAHRDAGRHAEALELAGAALELADGTGYQKFRADAFNVLGTVYRELGCCQRSRDHHERALESARTIGNPYAEATALIGLAAVLTRQDRYDQAADLAREALRVSTDMGFATLRAQALTCLARVQLAVGSLAEACRDGECAVTALRGTGARLELTRTHALLAEVHERAGRPDHAAEHRRRAADLRVEAGDPATRPG